MVSESKVVEVSSLNNCPRLMTTAFCGWWPGFQLLRDGLWSGQFSADRTKQRQINDTWIFKKHWQLHELKTCSHHQTHLHFSDWGWGWVWQKKPPSTLRRRYTFSVFAGGCEHVPYRGSLLKGWKWLGGQAEGREVLREEVVELSQVGAGVLGPPAQGHNLEAADGWRAVEPQRPGSGWGHHLSAWYRNLMSKI